MGLVVGWAALGELTLTPIAHGRGLRNDLSRGASQLTRLLNCGRCSEMGQAYQEEVPQTEYSVRGVCRRMAFEIVVIAHQTPTTSSMI